MRVHPYSHTNNCNHTKQKSLTSQAVVGFCTYLSLAIISTILQSIAHEQQNLKSGPVCDRINGVLNQTDACPIDIFNKYIYSNGVLSFYPSLDFLHCWHSGKLNLTNTTTSSINNCKCNSAALKNFTKQSMYLNKEHPKYNPDPNRSFVQGFKDLGILSKLGCTLESRVERVCEEVVTESFLTEQKCSDKITDLIVAKTHNATFWDTNS
ncbi:MAG: hypothetical protein S4CHLAM6_08570 [Chlamydiae bacterium]|nr:hypothetical protein [Chlamydiota bacterium]